MTPVLNESDDLTVPTDETDDLKRAARRCAYFVAAFNAYNAKLQNVGLHSAVMNKVLLGNCIESYFLDIRRLKTFHGMERADRFKIAGYSLKWLSKIKPIQVGPLEAVPPAAKRRGLLINADFALICAMSIAKVDYAKVDQRIRSGLLYAAHYRDIEGGNMALQMLTLAQAYPRTPGVA